MAAQIKKILLLYTDKYYLIKPVYPFGLDLVARHLRKAGYDVTLGYPFLPHADQRANLKNLLERIEPDLIGLGLRNLDTTMSCEPYGDFRDDHFQALTFMPDIQNLVTTIKALRPRVPLIAGGGAFTVAPGAILQRLGIDFGIAGEGEAALLQFIQTYPDMQACDQISGLVYKDTQGYRSNPRRTYNFSHYGLFTRRDPQFLYAIETAGLPVQTKRGCNRTCSFCVEPLIEGRQFILRPPEDVVAELETLSDRNPDVDTVFFVDTEFNTPDLSHCMAIIQMIVKASLQQRFRFASQFLPRPFSPELADWLRRAGFALILTADSFSDSVLQENHAPYRQKDILQTIELCEQFAIDCTVDLIFGLPGETWQTLDETIALLKNYPPNYQRRYEYTCGARIYQGTPLFHRITDKPDRQHVYGRFSPGYIDPCFYCAPTSPRALKKHVDDQLPFALDFENDYDTIKQQTLAMGYLADQLRWDETVAHFMASDLKAKTAVYLYLVKKMAAADQLAKARTVLSHLAEKIERDNRGDQYAETLPVIQYYLNLLT